MSAVNVEETFCRESRDIAGGETSSVGAALRLGMVKLRLSLKVSAPYTTSAISTSDTTGAPAE